MSLFTSEIQQHLTSAPIDQVASQSFPGMAHFAGTGPQGKTCRECVFWKHALYDYRSKNGKYGGQIKPATCGRYRQMVGIEGSKVPDDARACKYFEQIEVAPARYQKG